MKPFQKISSKWIKVEFFLLTVLICGCSTASTPDDEALKLVNNTARPIVYSFVELNASDQAEIPPLKVSSNAERLVQPGASITLRFEAIKNGGEPFNQEDMVRILIWEVAGDSAYIKRGLTFSGEELNQRALIEIEDYHTSCVASSANEQASSVQDTLFSIASDPPLSSEQEHQLSMIWNRPTTIELYVARLADNVSSMLKEGQVIRLDTSPKDYVLAVGEQVERRAPDDISWAGTLQNDFGSTTLVLGGKGVTGSLQRWNDGNSLNFRFVPLGNGLQAIVCVDASKFPAD